VRILLFLWSSFGGERKKKKKKRRKQGVALMIVNINGGEVRSSAWCLENRG
jgi:hypothetical protein